MPVVDAWSQIPTPRFMQAPWLDTLLRWTGIDRNAPSVADTLAAMDAAGIDIALLSAWHGPQGSLISNDEVAACVRQACLCAPNKERHADKSIRIHLVNSVY